jgi:hypothetical protein
VKTAWPETAREGSAMCAREGAAVHQATRLRQRKQGGGRGLGQGRRAKERWRRSYRCARLGL